MMEGLQFSSFAALPLAFFLLLIVMIRRGNNRPIAKQLPPSPWKLPIIGNLHHLLGPFPHRTLRDLSRKHGPLMHLRLGEVDLVVVSSPETVKEILKTHDLNFASRPRMIASTIMCYDNRTISFAPYGSYWRQVRKICVVELLSARHVRASSTIREEEVSNLVRCISTSGGSPVNLTEKLRSLANTMTSRMAFGSDSRHGPKFISAVAEGTKLASGFSLPDLFPSLGFIDSLLGFSSRSERVHRKFDEILDEIIKEHQMKREANKTRGNGAEQEGSDLIDVLLDLKEEGKLDLPLTLIDIKAVVMDMLLGGTETTSATMEWTMSELMAHHEVMKKVQEEVRGAAKGKATVEEADLDQLHYLKMVLKEVLRLHPALPLLLPRVCGESCVVGGYEIPAGSRVVINAWAVARDPEHWEDAERFKPARFDGSSVDFKGCSYEYLPFGGGRRMCPGLSFGLANVELALARLLFHFDWELPDGMKPEELDMTEVFGATVGRKSDLCLIPTPHVPLPAI